MTVYIMSLSITDIHFTFVPVDMVVFISNPVVVGCVVLFVRLFGFFPPRGDCRSHVDTKER